MKWLDQLIVNKAERIVLNYREQEEKKSRKGIKELTMNSIQLVGAGQMPMAKSERLDARADMNFRMYRAENGYVMEVQSYDKRTERNNINLHVITEDQDLGSAIAHIITVESLKV